MQKSLECGKIQFEHKKNCILLKQQRGNAAVISKPNLNMNITYNSFRNNFEVSFFMHRDLLSADNLRGNR